MIGVTPSATAAIPVRTAHIAARPGGEMDFEQRLGNIVESSDSEDEEQTKILLLMAREVHSIRQILFWMLVVVPIAVVVLVLFLTNMPHNSGRTP